MEFSILSAKDFKTTRWSGGSTTELFIFPKGSTYQHRDFLFRLSTADVEADSSEFTRLPGVSRTLVVLDGEVTLSHSDQHVVLLKKFGADHFKGDWNTTCKGTCTDFNLMTRGKVSGVVRAIVIENEQQDQIEIDDQTDWYFIYMYAGSADITINKTHNTVGPGDVAVMENSCKIVFTIKGIERCELVLVQIKGG